MKNDSSSAEELKTIRKMMEESTKFLSLSGLSGIFPGLFAIAGAAVAYFLILNFNNIRHQDYFGNLSVSVPLSVHIQMIADASIVLLLSLASAFYFSLRNAKRIGTSFNTPASKRLIVSLFIPLFTGGAFGIILMMQNQIQLVIPVFLVFYGLSLINAVKFTYNEIFYLGILEIFTGILCVIFPGYGLIFWIIGFGILHIVYGLYMYRKYEA